MNIGIYGGSFNPVHFGHVGLVRWVVEHTDLDEVWMMVSPNNPLKDSRILADERVRLEQVREAVGDIPGVRVSDFEFSLPRPTYTANTLRALSRTYPEHTFTLIIGEDNLAIFTQWREWQYILSHFRLFVYPRHSSSAEPAQSTESQPTTQSTSPVAPQKSKLSTSPSPTTPIPEATLYQLPTFPTQPSPTLPSSEALQSHIVYLSSAPYFDISSTEIRNRRHNSK